MLNLKQGESGEPHCLTRCIEQVWPAGGVTLNGETETVVFRQLGHDSLEPLSNQTACTSQVGLQYGRHCFHSRLVFPGEAAIQLPAHPERERAKRDQHGQEDGPKHSAPEAQREVSCWRSASERKRGVPSQSTVSAGDPRRTIARCRVSING